MESRENIANIAFYRFVALDDPKTIQTKLLNECRRHGLKGTILVAHEGVNAMLAGPQKNVEDFVQELQGDGRFKDILIKWSYSSFVPFKRLLVKTKKEILTDRSKYLEPSVPTGPGVSTRAPSVVEVPYLKPGELQKALESGEEMVLIDVRNDFEVKFGSFKGALNPKTRSFSQFAAFVENLKIDKSAKIVTYCTGGIRCEKGSANLLAAGYKNVFQLEGGILEYLRQTRGSFFEGSCFVFDEREALNHQLKSIRECEKP